MRFQVRKRLGHWEVWSLAANARSWELSIGFPTWWQAMVHVTGQVPYGMETPWTPGRRPLWV